MCTYYQETRGLEVGIAKKNSICVFFLQCNFLTCFLMHFGRPTVQTFLLTSSKAGGGFSFISGKIIIKSLVFFVIEGQVFFLGAGPFYMMALGSKQPAAATSLKCWLRREEIVVVLFAFLLFFFTPLFCGLFWERREDSSMGNLRPTKWLSCLIIYVLLLGQRGQQIWHQNSPYWCLSRDQTRNPKAFTEKLSFRQAGV